MSTTTTPIRERCQGTTRSGQPCRAWARPHSPYCRQHQHADSATLDHEFYGHVLTAEDRQHFAEALAQEGLDGELALLRLTLRHLVAEVGLEQSSEVLRTVQAIARALKETRAGGGSSRSTDLDQLIREEGQNWLRAASATPESAESEEAHQEREP